jgi:ribosomal protein S18 acetylase RimI-like enzyme
MSEVVVREAREDEYGEVAELTLEAYAEFEPKLSAAWWRYYRRDLGQVTERAAEGSILVADDGGGLVGAVAYQPPPKSGSGSGRPGGSAWIRTLAVPPAQRGRGIGRLLTEACIARARADRATAIGLNTTFLMPVAKAMYERMGFAQVAEHTDWQEGIYWTYSLPIRPLPS